MWYISVLSFVNKEAKHFSVLHKPYPKSNETSNVWGATIATPLIFCQIAFLYCNKGKHCKMQNKESSYQLYLSVFKLSYNWNEVKLKFCLTLLFLFTIWSWAHISYKKIMFDPQKTAYPYVIANPSPKCMSLFYNSLWKTYKGVRYCICRFHINK